MVVKSPKSVGAITDDSELQMIEARDSKRKRKSPRSKVIIKYGRNEKDGKGKTPASRPAQEQRRFSPRIQLKQRAEKELSDLKRVELIDGQGSEGVKCKESTTLSNKKKRRDKNVGIEKVEKVDRLVKKVDVNASVEKKTEDEELLVRKRSEKELLVHKRVELLEGQEEGGDGECQEVTTRSYKRKRSKKDICIENGKKVHGLVKKVDVNAPSVSGGGVGADSVEKSVSLKVKETLRLFNKHYLQLVHEEEMRCAKLQADRKALIKGSKSKKGVPLEFAKNSAKRPDLKAISKMMENGQVLYPDKRIGDVPGIKVGHQFYSRAEMVAVGFHSHWLNGIDYMGQSYKKTYEDDLDNAEDVIYTGQGGHNLVGDKRQIKDQVLERGNLALKNCVDQDVPVRVVRGHESKSSYCGKVYTYDGLYKVDRYWAEKGISGFTVFKYRLKRLDGQPVMTTNQVFFTYGRVPESVTEIRGLVCEDITGGLEDKPIPATNLVDDPPVAPAGFKYCKSIQVSRSVKLPSNGPGCNCKGSCVDPRKCACAIRNGSDFPYVSREGGRLIEAKDVVFECGPQCGCGPDCVNRTSQKGLRYRLEVFRTAKKGWAVRSWDFIPSGAPVCEYVGKLIRAEDLDNAGASGNYYIFDIDCLQTMRGLGGRERRSRDVVPCDNVFERHDDQKIESLSEFCIDAGSTGNVARFINHSCEPNLFVQCVLNSHHEPKLARVMLFAADNIPPLQEITYDYGYPLDSVMGSDGKIIKMDCYCGASDCRKRLF